MRLRLILSCLLFVTSSTLTQIVFTNEGASANPDINNTTNATSFANTSWTPPTSGLIVLYVGAKKTTGGGPTTPTVSGNGVTWVQIGATENCTGNHGLSLFGADASGSSAGITTIDFGGVEQHHCSASFFSVTGVDLSGGVAAAFVQNPRNQLNNVTSITVTLAAAGDADNRPISSVYHDENEVTTPRTNWTELDDLPNSSRLHGMDTQQRDDTFETTASGSWTTIANGCIIAAELKASVAAAARRIFIVD